MQLVLSLVFAILFRRTFLQTRADSIYSDLWQVHVSNSLHEYRL